MGGGERVGRGGGERERAGWRFMPFTWVGQQASQRVAFVLRFRMSSKHIWLRGRWRAIDDSVWGGLMPMKGCHSLAWSVTATRGKTLGLSAAGTNW